MSDATGSHGADDAILVEAEFGQQLALLAVIDEAVGQAKTQYRNLQSAFGKHTLDFRTGATDHCIFFDTDEQGMVPGKFDDQRFIERLHEAHVDDRRIEFFAGGEGTQADPYRIETEAQLRGFAEATQNGKLSTTNLYIRLDADIALSDEPWTPIAKFGGSFDGDGHTVSGMTIGGKGGAIE